MSIRLKVAKAYALVLEADELLEQALREERYASDPSEREISDARNNLCRASDDLKWSMTESAA